MISLRRAEADDARFVWEVNNHPSTRAVSISGTDIPWESHTAWYAKKIADPSSRLWIACEADESVGVIRVDADGTVSIAVHPDHRGHGYGTEMIQRASEAARGGPDKLLALVRIDNDISRRAFERAGFRTRERRTVDGVSLYAMELELTEAAR